MLSLLILSLSKDEPRGRAPRRQMRGNSLPQSVGNSKKFSNTSNAQASKFVGRSHGNPAGPKAESILRP